MSLQVQVGSLTLPNVYRYIHENVSISAWGIAIHEKSRLIAVSSNRREVTVFVPAYTPDNATTEDTLSALDETISRTGLPSKTESVFFPPLDVDNISVHFRRRSYRKILQLGREGHNIPSITFSNDKDGNAQSVLAADVRISSAPNFPFTFSLRSSAGLASRIKCKAFSIILILEMR